LQPSALAKRVSFVLLLALIVFYFYGLGHLPLVGPDEPRYAQVAREMLMRGDLITPTLGGQVWFEKPVLLYWVMMFCYKIFGVTEQAARLGPATAGVLTILAIYWLGRKVEIASGDFELTDFGFWTALVTGTSLGMIVFSRGASFDILVTMTTTWALVLFFVEEIEATRRRRTFFLTGFYVFVGLSLLAKGLVGLLPLAVVGTYYLMRRKVPPRRLILSLAWGIPLAMTIAALWYGPVIARHGWLFIDQFIIQHHFARYLSNKYHHPQPFFFYVIVIVPLTLPWTPFLLYGLGRLRTIQWRRQDSVDMLRVFSFSWVLLPMLVFSFSGSKLPGYILPVVPAAALLGGERLTRFISTGVIGRGAMRGIALLAIIFAVGAPFYARRFEAIPFSCAIAIAITLMTAGLIALIMTRLAAVSAISIACSTVISLMILLNCGEAGLGQRESVKSLIQIADARGYSGLRVCSLHTIDETAHFYASGRLIYGADSEPAKFEGVAEILEAARINNGAVLVLVPLEYVGQLTELKSAKTELLGDNGRIAIVAVRLL
jgi:4-amino-4-deoxy-L-arabinose transferase-like glycosyltransferase